MKTLKTPKPHFWAYSKTPWFGGSWLGSPCKHAAAEAGWYVRRELPGQGGAVCFQSRLCVQGERGSSAPPPPLSTLLWCCLAAHNAIPILTLFHQKCYPYDRIWGTQSSLGSSRHGLLILLLNVCRFLWHSKSQNFSIWNKKSKLWVVVI